MPAALIIPPRSIGAWVALFDHADLPVLASTEAALRELAANEDAVDAQMLAQAMVEDPLMTIKLLAHVAQLRRGREGSDTETVIEALVMLGIPPFFRAFAGQPTVEDQLADQPEALLGFGRVLQRARRAARFATSFAVHRMDHDVPVIHEAALLHDFGELLLWLRAPQLAQQVETRLHGDATLRSASVQRQLLNVELAELEQALMQRWRLPALLLAITFEHGFVGKPSPGKPSPQMQNVQVALRVARHSAAGWDNAALPDDVQDVAALLNMSPDAALRLLHQIDDGNS